MKIYLTTDLDKAAQFDCSSDAHEYAALYERETKQIATVCHAPRGLVVRCYRGHGAKLAWAGWLK